MSENPRSTQFAGFAEKLYQEIQDMACSFRTAPSPKVLKERECEIIARRAYDLACHVVASLDEDVAWRKGKGYYLVNRIVENDVPDLTTWPDEGKKG